MNMDKNIISREAMLAFKQLYGVRTPREMADGIARLEAENAITSAEYDAIMLADWRELSTADPDGFRTRAELDRMEDIREELDCAFAELATARGKVESIIAESLARLGGKFELTARMTLLARVFDTETGWRQVNVAACDERAHQVYSLYTATNGDVYATFCDGCRDLPFFENCTEADLVAIADLLVKA